MASAARHRNLKLIDLFSDKTWIKTGFSIIAVDLWSDPIEENKNLEKFSPSNRQNGADSVVDYKDEATTTWKA